ncbi:fgfr1 oncogene partner 2 [Anaeramoeba flamelloides]|uniref:Fgfr1 oncogene partner 2 n=1 Tax=Anaeramoeba flamelloides TaxID=1746091 RepID=A0ABQ8YI88_9EUKA|nr:fgfr1 oncogene partner 2 [Anaeramoeba flamelloides]
MAQFSEILDSLILETTELQEKTQNFNEITKDLTQRVADLNKKMKKKNPDKGVPKNQNQNHLTTDLQEYQTSLDLIMKKHREVVQNKNHKHQKKLNKIISLCDDFENENNHFKKENEYLKEKNKQMTDVLERAANVQDVELNEKIQEIVKLREENRVLRELLEISGYEIKNK